MPFKREIRGVRLFKCPAEIEWWKRELFTRDLWRIVNIPLCFHLCYRVKSIFKWLWNVRIFKHFSTHFFTSHSPPLFLFIQHCIAHKEFFIKNIISIAESSTSLHIQIVQTVAWLWFLFSFFIAQILWTTPKRVKCI